MQEQPGRCLGCLVVVATDVVPELSALSPRMAALAKASKPDDDSCSWVGLVNAAILLFLKSMHIKYGLIAIIQKWSLESSEAD